PPDQRPRSDPTIQKIISLGVLSRFGDAHHAAHCPDAAHDAWQRALDILTQLDHPYANQIRGKLALHGDRPEISDKERGRGRYELDV
ncbi:hypothetical protein K7472_02670, partial [Streptomyces sp. PTM05]